MGGSVTDVKARSLRQLSESVLFNDGIGFRCIAWRGDSRREGIAREGRIQIDQQVAMTTQTTGALRSMSGGSGGIFERG
jgi:hypothetical protein